MRGTGTRDACEFPARGELYHSTQ